MTQPPSDSYQTPQQRYDQYPYGQQYGQPQPMAYGAYPYQPYPENKHSGMGVASFIIGLGIGLLELAMVIAAAVMESQAGPSGLDEKSPAAIILGLVLLTGLLVALLGAGLGAAACLQANRKKIFGILGILINGMILLVVVGLMVVGLAMK